MSEIQIEVAHTFLSELFSTGSNYIELRFISNSDSQIHRRFIKTGTKINWDEIQKMNQQGFNVYFGVCPRAREAGKKEDIETCCTLWCDLDAKDFDKEDCEHGKKLIMEQIAKVLPQTLRPTITVDSGHGYHLYWMLNEPIKENLDNVESILKGLAVKLGGDHTHDRSRILRLPGTYNVKKSNSPVLCKIVEWTLGRRFSLDQFAQYQVASSTTSSVVPVTFSNQVSEIDLNKLRVGDRVKQLIKSGWKEDNGHKSRSETDFAVVMALVKENHTDDEIKAVFSNRQFGISSKYLAHSSPNDYLRLTIQTARSMIATKDNVHHSTANNNQIKKHDQKSFVLDEEGAIYEMCYDPKKEFSFFFARFKGGKVEYVNHATLRSGRIIYPFIKDEMIVKGVILLPSYAIPFQSEKILIESIRQFIHKYVAVGPFFEKLATYYVLFTWIYDSFNTLAYLRVIGNYGSGKTRFLIVMSALCYKSTLTSGAATTSPIFRLIDKYNGTLIINEGDFPDSDEYSRITKILNCGNEKGFPVIITDGEGKNFEPKAYEVYGPKLIATRQLFSDKALESRCISEEMDEQYRWDIPIILDEEGFKSEAINLRNQLLMWRFLRYGKTKLKMELVDQTIEPRLNQIMLPLASMITDPIVLNEFKEFMRAYNQKMIQDRNMGFEAEVAEVINRLYFKDMDMHMKMIAEDVNTKHAVGEKPISARKIGHIIRDGLRLKTDRDSEGFYIIKNQKNEDRLKVLVRKYGIPESKD